MSKPKHHVIEAEDVEKVIDGLNVVAAGSYGEGSNKSLRICTRSGKLIFRVQEWNKLIVETSDMTIAVTAYNYLD